MAKFRIYTLIIRFSVKYFRNIFYMIKLSERFKMFFIYDILFILCVFLREIILYFQK